MRPGVNAAFVPNGESRRETAKFLVDTANENGIDQREIKAVNGGFYVSEELADLLYDDAESSDTTDPEPEPKPEPDSTTSTTKKTSGNRAAKTDSKKKE